MARVGFDCFSIAVLIAGAPACNERLEVLHARAASGEAGTNGDAGRNGDVGANGEAGVSPPADASFNPDAAKPSSSGSGLDVCLVSVGPEPIDRPTTIVGDNTPSSCTEQALAGALSAGGTVVFRCGPSPVTLGLTTEKVITKDTVIDGEGAVTLSGDDKTRILHVSAGAGRSPRVTLQNLTLERGLSNGAMIAGASGGAVLIEAGSLIVHDTAFRNNSAAAAGGAIGGSADVQVSGSVFDGNSAAAGGAIGMSGGSLTVVNSRLEHNSARGQGMTSGRGGAISIISGSSGAVLCGAVVSNNDASVLGGAVFLSTIAGGTANIDRSTFDGNQCGDQTVTPPTGSVSAIFAQGVALTMTSSTISNNVSFGLSALWVGGFADRGVAASIDLVNVTIANNRAYPRMPVTDTGIGGGLWVDQMTRGRLLNCTIVRNEAQFGAGIVGYSAVSIDNSIIQNSALNPFNSVNCEGMQGMTPGTPRGSNDLQWPSSNGTGPEPACAQNVTFMDAKLGDLLLGDGPTATIPPLPGSPALKRGENCPATDQRGKSRKAPCTLGAFEGD